MADMPCPLCQAELEPTPSKHGTVWLCRQCRAGAATLPILRKVAPRPFVNEVWRAALREGLASASICPSCTQPFTSLSGSPVDAQPELEVCTRCSWVWLNPKSLAMMSELREPSPPVLAMQRLAESSALREAALSHSEAKQYLHEVAGFALLEVMF